MCGMQMNSIGAWAGLQPRRQTGSYASEASRLCRLATVTRGAQGHTVRDIQLSPAIAPLMNMIGD